MRPAAQVGSFPTLRRSRCFYIDNNSGPGDVFVDVIVLPFSKKARSVKITQTQAKTLLSEKGKIWLLVKSPPSHYVMFRFFRYFPKL